jgi:carbon-monoxide dehydrogenase medium subunit
VKSLEGVNASADGLNSDIHADAAYRAHLIGVMCRRAVNKANGK